LRGGRPSALTTRHLTPALSPIEAEREAVAALFAFMKPELVAAFCPALDVLVDEPRIAELFEVGADFPVGDAVVEPLVDLSADMMG